jgi:hypothetical protein
MVGTLLWDIALKFLFVRDYLQKSINNFIYFHLCVPLDFHFFSHNQLNYGSIFVSFHFNYKIPNI